MLPYKLFHNKFHNKMNTLSSHRFTIFFPSVLPLGWVKFVIINFVSHSIIEMTVLDILKTTSATIDNNVGTQYSRNDVQPCHFDKKIIL